jgi:hypothetical protein
VVQEHTAGPQQIPGPTEVLWEMSFPDVLKHTDADDLVILQFMIDVAVVRDFHAASITQPCFAQALSCYLCLSHTQCDPHGVHTIVSDSVHDQSSKTAADIQKSLSRAQPQLPADVIQLAFLGRIQTLVRLAED